MKMDILERYQDAATVYAKKWGIDNQHVIEIMTSVMRHRDGVMTGGGFVEAIIANNLSLAVNRADDTCIKYIKQIVAARDNCHL